MAFARYLSACLCFKNAAPYLSEWLAFYTVLGVEHFYLYNNESTDNFLAPVAPYLRRGLATLIDFPGRGRQKAIYEDCLGRFGAETQWLSFCDDDEFLFPTADISLPDALSRYEHFAGVGACWMMYGSGGREARPPGLVIENYTRRNPLPDPHVKCIVQPARIVEPLLIAHQFRCRDALMVDEKFHPLRGPFASSPTADILRINHYATKSREELIERRSRVQANTGELSELSIAQWIELDATFNETEDPCAVRYVERVREMMKRLG